MSFLVIKTLFHTFNYLKPCSVVPYTFIIVLLSLSDDGRKTRTVHSVQDVNSQWIYLVTMLMHFVLFTKLSLVLVAIELISNTSIELANISPRSFPWVERASSEPVVCVKQGLFFHFSSLFQIYLQ